jgi:hypothetical protein
MGDAVACFTAARVQRLPICGEKTAIAWQPFFLASVFVLRLSWQIIIVFQMELKIIVDFSRLQGLMGIEGSGFSSASTVPRATQVQQNETCHLSIDTLETRLRFPRQAQDKPIRQAS